MEKFLLLVIFFYRGLRKINKKEVVSIDIRDKLIFNLANNVAIQISFQGMDKRSIINAKDRLNNILKYQPIGYRDYKL